MLTANKSGRKSLTFKIVTRENVNIIIITILSNNIREVKKKKKSARVIFGYAVEINLHLHFMT